ncbi:STAS domain-containing protein [Sulfuricella sp.]|uniref:STAS domain-containing protein n=1 Tax=Sulfuricella sp. TaxID=2099377 RepID=UPI002D0C1570|nr:STAS domain-containing protein [Sulfuricella sp.]HUX63703.1 STAS domain-containing protein [Sulfuricella sp.]
MVAIEKQGKCNKLLIGVDVTASTAGTLWNVFLANLDDCEEMEINLSQVNMVDTEGLRWVRKAMIEASRNGKSLRFVSGRPETPEVLSLYRIFCEFVEPAAR